MSKDSGRCILLVHNHYQQGGGEDSVFAAETQLLRAYGEEVVTFTAHNDQIADLNPLSLGRRLFWNTAVYRDLRIMMQESRPYVLHAHNIFPLLSPAVYSAARDEGIPVVQTIHNFRLLCVNALLYREGRVCEACIGKGLMWPAVVHKCYRDSRVLSAAVAAMLHYHRVTGTWRHLVHVYIALTELARQKLVAGGLPADRIVVKSNFAEPSTRARNGLGDYLLFVGRLSVEKGIGILLAAWRATAELPPLLIVGDGPLCRDVELEAMRDGRLRWLGRCAHEEVESLLSRARALMFPSLWYEGCPLVILEAFSAGVPVIGSALGASGLLVEAGRTGLTHKTGDPRDLAEKALWAWQHPEEMLVMGEHCRRRIRDEHSGASHYQFLRWAYARAATVRDLSDAPEHEVIS